MRLIKNLPGLFKILLTILIYGFRLRTLKKARNTGDSSKDIEAIIKVEREISNFLCKIFHFEVKVFGRENVPQGPVLFVSNHQAYSDVIAILKALEGHQTGFVAKDNLKKVPLFSTLMDAMRSIYITRDNPREAVKTINQGCELLKNGYSLVIFPEGTRSRCSDMGEFKAGSFKLATRAGVPVVPITLNGTYHNYEETGVLRPAKVTLVFHKPIYTENISKEETMELCQSAESQIRTTLAEIVNKTGYN